MAAFDDILNAADATDRSVFEKYPALKQSLTELDDLRVKYPDVDKRLGTFENWWRTNVGDNKEGKTKAQLQAEADATRLREQNQKLQEGLETDMTFEEVLKNLGDAGYAKKADVEATIQASLANLGTRFAPAEETKTQIGNLAAGSQYVFEEMIPIILQHKDEFKENLNPREIFKFMDQNKIQDIHVAYDRMVAARRQESGKLAKEAEDKRVQDAIETAKREGEEKGRREAAMGPSGHIPTDQGGISPAMGHLQRGQLERTGAIKAADDVPAPPDKVKLGDGVLAQLGYEDLSKSRQGNVQ